MFCVFRKLLEAVQKSCKNLPYLLYLYVSCKRCMHMHFLFSLNPMKLGLIGMLSASLHYITIEEHHVIYL